MRRLRYPEFAAHQQAHKSFLSRFQGFSRALQAGETVDPGELFDFVSGWFKQHMAEQDGPLAGFLNARKAA